MPIPIFCCNCKWTVRTRWPWRCGRGFVEGAPSGAREPSEGSERLHCAIEAMVRTCGPVLV